MNAQLRGLLLSWIGLSSLLVGSPVFASIQNSRCLSALVALALIQSQSSPSQPSRWQILHREVPDDPYLPPEPQPPGIAGNPPTRGPYVSIQVNVDSSGNNIRGDAANEPSLAIDPTNPNRIVIGWRQFDTINSNFRQAGWAYSHNRGASWTFPGVLERGVFRSDPVLEADANGNFYYMSLKGDFTTDLFKSFDGGVTWSQKRAAYGGDKEWMVIDKTPSMGRGHVYEWWSVFYGCCSDRTFTRSVDGGLTFMNPIRVPNNIIWGTMAVDADGNLYLAGLEYYSGGIYVAKSSNAKNRNVTPTFDFASLVNLNGSLSGWEGPNPEGLLGQLWVDVDRSNGPNRGNVYVLASVDPPGSDPLDVYFARSTDGGRTWSSPVRINNDPPRSTSYQWFGTMSVAPDGRIDVIWNDTRNDSSVTYSELYYAYSYDGGRTWSLNIPISPRFNHYLGYPQQNKLGDYYDMESDIAEANIAYAATFNGEQDVYFLRVGDCNRNGIHDGKDIAERRSTDRNNSGIPDECETRPGDVNFDGCVNDADLSLVLAAYGRSGQNLYEDLNGDGVVNDADLTLVLANYGQGC